MSLGRLLTAGRSLIGLENSNTPYRMRGAYLLPKFGGKKNPFADPNANASPESTADARAADSAPVGTKQSAEPLRAASFQLTPAELAAARLKETARLPVPCALPRDPSVSSGRASRRWTIPGAALWKKISFSSFTMRWWRRKPESKPAVPRFDREPVQGELSLDSVRVVRNDLSEADVEIVPAKLMVQPKAEKPKREANVQETRELIQS